MKSVNVVINDQPEIKCQNVIDNKNGKRSPLYVARWVPKELPAGKKHNMKVTAIFNNGKKETTITEKRQFILDTESIADEGKFILNIILKAGMI